MVGRKDLYQIVFDAQSELSEIEKRVNEANRDLAEFQITQSIRDSISNNSDIATSNNFADGGYIDTSEMKRHLVTELERLGPLKPIRTPVTEWLPMEKKQADEPEYGGDW